MIISEKFIIANTDICDFDNPVPAPYFRKKFTLSFKPENAEITICGLGFYELYINGKDVTKGPLAPYISNPDDVCYYDNYDISELLVKGDNVIAVVLGNGMRNAFGGPGWDFNKAHHRGPVTVALCLEAQSRENKLIIEGDETFKIHPSPILSNDIRAKYLYDSAKEVDGWNKIDFDDSDWDNALPGKTPKGIKKLCEAAPIKTFGEISPVSIEHFDSLPFLYEETWERKPVADTIRNDIYVYDFGINTTGVIKVKINGIKGQKITLRYGEHFVNGKFAINSTFQFRKNEKINECLRHYSQVETYILKGGEEELIPKFKYNGFRYVYVEGLTKEQAKKETLTYIVMHSDIEKRADFSCSCEVMNKLYKCAMNSDLSNFFYFPTDCPHREKNGWTGDVAMSSEHLVLNHVCESSLKEWMTSVRGAQRLDGALPGIIPTGGWGFHWGNGPVWDSVCVMIPYYVYKYTGDKSVICENAALIMRYLQYINSKRDKKGLVEIGLGDWIDPYKDKHGHTASPLVVTDSIMTHNIAKMACHLFKEAGLEFEADFAAKILESMRISIRKHLIDYKTMTVLGNCQTSQTYALYSGIFEKEEKRKAQKKLLEIIHKDGDVTYLGMIGVRYIFHVLTEMGEYNLAYKMLTSEEYTAYGYWIKKDATALWECFRPSEAPRTNSKNHHFLGDISSWFIRKIAGLNPNPYVKDISYFEITPHFIDALSYAEGEYNSSFGKVFVRWERVNEKIVIKLTVPPLTKGKIKLPKGYKLSGNTNITSWKKEDKIQEFYLEII